MFFLLTTCNYTFFCNDWDDEKNWKNIKLSCECASSDIVRIWILFRVFIGIKWEYFQFTQRVSELNYNFNLKPVDGNMKNWFEVSHGVCVNMYTDCLFPTNNLSTHVFDHSRCVYILQTVSLIAFIHIENIATLFTLINFNLITHSHRNDAKWNCTLDIST